MLRMLVMMALDHRSRDAPHSDLSPEYLSTCRPRHLDTYLIVSRYLGLWNSLYPLSGIRVRPWRLPKPQKGGEPRAGRPCSPHGATPGVFMLRHDP